MPHRRLAGPSVAGAVQKGLNADQVDGKHAVGAKAKIAKRKNKLVATNRQGYLPDNIIKRAPDAAKLGGVAASSLRRLSFSSGALATNGPAGAGLAGIELDDAGLPQIGLTFVVPPEHPQGAAVAADLTWMATGEPCGFHLMQQGFATRPSTGNLISGAWRFANDSTAFTVAVADDPDPEVAGRTRLVWDQPMSPGDVLFLGLDRDTAHLADTCGLVYVHGIDVTY